MGLIKAGLGAVGGVLADQWKEFFYCEAMDKEVMVTKGQKRISGRSSNTKGSDNIISNGSGIAVADGQCMIIVDQGRVVKYVQNPANLHMTLPPNRRFSQVILDRASLTPFLIKIQISSVALLLLTVEYPADVRRFCCVFHPRWLINSKLRQQTTAFHTYIIAKKTLIH